MEWCGEFILFSSVFMYCCSLTMAQPASADRQNLLDRLLDAVKQCQVRFGGRSELATDADSRVSCLCAQFEAVLQHGLKKPTTNPLSALQ